jgi:hypothetical protein
MTTSNQFLLREEYALKDLIAGITVKDGKSAARPMKVWFNQPDVELQAITYPYALIDLVDIQQSRERQVGGGMIYDYDLNGAVPDGGDVYSYPQPVLYDLYYQITTYARHPRHDREIIRQMLKYKTPGKWGYLPVPNIDESVYEYRHMFVEGFAKRDTITDDRRLYRNTITVRILSEMTEETAQDALAIVQEVQINPTTTGIPTDYFPLTRIITTE